jgi:hypothetical protein
MQFVREDASGTGRLTAVTIMAAAVILVAAGVAVLVGPGRASAAEAPGAYPVHVKSTFNGKCLGVERNTINANGIPVRLWNCRGSAGGMLWEFQPVPGRPGYYRIRNYQYNRCLNADNSGGAFPNGAKVQLWDCDPQWLDANAMWTLTGPSSGFDMSTLAGGWSIVLDADISGSREDGMRAQMYSWIPEQSNQLWIWTRRGD